MGHFYDNFLTALEERYPHKPDLVNALADLLRIEKESIYRRLRRDVYFSAEEMMCIASAWNISLDNIICANPQKTRPFHFKMINYVNPDEEDYLLLEQYNRDLEVIARNDGRMFEVLNSLSRGIYGRSEALTRFFTMKWLYKSAEPGKALPFCDIHITERMRALDMEYIRCIHDIREVHSIHDNRLIEDLVNEIIYFQSIGMLTVDEAVLLHDELLKLTDYLEDVTIRGTFPNTGNKMFFYLSHTWIETEYILYESSSLSLCLINILERNSVSSTDQMVMGHLMNMVQAMKRTSVLMSESNALQQAEFYTRQRKIIKALMQDQGLKINQKYFLNQIPFKQRM